MVIECIAMPVTIPPFFARLHHSPKAVDTSSHTGGIKVSETISWSEESGSGMSIDLQLLGQVNGKDKKSAEHNKR